MTFLMILLVLLVGAVAAYLICQSSEPSAVNDTDPEQALKAAVELHRIRRTLDTAWAKSEQRRDGAALRRDIAKAMKETGDD